MFISGLIFIILLFSQLENIKTFDVFIEGVKDGLSVVYNLFPTLIGLLLAVSLLRYSGVTDGIVDGFSSILYLCKFPKELATLIILRPISGSASLAFLTDLVSEYKDNTKIIYAAAVLLGGTETTLYALSVYTSETNKKMSAKLVCLAVIGNLMGAILAVLVSNLYFN